jgi:hypothetical protein
MNHETAQFVKELFIKHAGFIPKCPEELESTHCEDIVLMELCEALNIYIDSDEDA